MLPDRQAFWIEKQLRTILARIPETWNAAVLGSVGTRLALQLRRARDASALLICPRGRLSLLAFPIISVSSADWR
jgi:hypothetical protein